MQVQIIVVGAFALLDLQAEAGVEGLLAGAADPEVALARLAHLDHPLFQGPGADHDAVDLAAAVGRQRLVAAVDLGRRQGGDAVVVEGPGLARHAGPPEEPVTAGAVTGTRETVRPGPSSMPGR